MGLFDKKECSICGEKIGFLGNRKLEDGNLCKDCAKKLSPLFEERRHSTVEEIRQQLAYREENAKIYAGFTPDKVYCGVQDLKIDTVGRRFVFIDSFNRKTVVPDVISFDQITSCTMYVDDQRKELYREDANGEKHRYVPSRYEHWFFFHIKITVVSPWFEQMDFQLNRQPLKISDLERPELGRPGLLDMIMGTPAKVTFEDYQYKQYVEQCEEIISHLS